MKKDNRKHYLQAWLTFLKGKTEIHYPDLVKLLEKKFKASYSVITLKRYNATLIGNLIENGYVSGEKTGPLTIVKTISPPVLDKCLPRDFKKVRFDEKDLASAEKKEMTLPVTKKVRKKMAKAPQKRVKARSFRKKSLQEKKATIPARRVPRKDVTLPEQTAVYYVQQLTEHIAELENRLAAYERIFDTLRGLFGQEVCDMEEWIVRFLR